MSWQVGSYLSAPIGGTKLHKKLPALERNLVCGRRNTWGKQAFIKPHNFQLDQFLSFDTTYFHPIDVDQKVKTSKRQTKCKLRRNFPS